MAELVHQHQTATVLQTKHEGSRRKMLYKVLVNPKSNMRNGFVPIYYPEYIYIERERYIVKVSSTSDVLRHG